MDDLAKITGQRPVPTYSKNAISNFKLREGEVIGARMTLRGTQMWEFLDRFLNAAIPTIRAQTLGVVSRAASPVEKA